VDPALGATQIFVMNLLSCDSAVTLVRDCSGRAALMTST
jgi:hypothetical protein